MRSRSIRRAVTALVQSAGLMLTACTSETATDEALQPAVLREVAGSERQSIMLTEQAAERAGIELATISSQSPLSVPYSALLYDPDGDTWVYISTEPLVYVRHPVTVDTIDGDRVRLIDGPDPGTEVVTVGVAELYGAELGIGQ